MNPQDIFEFLKENLSMDLDIVRDSDYYGSWEKIVASLLLKNPETGEVETISSAKAETPYRSNDRH